MRRWAGLLAAAMLLVSGAAATAQEVVQFASLEDNGPGQLPTQLTAYLFKPAAAGRHPAIVFLHGCGGLISRITGQILRREQDWAAEFNRLGYVVFMVDSFKPRGVEQMCAPATYQAAVAERRPRDAYAALFYLQNRPEVRADQIGAIGWSQGGGTVLWTIPRQSRGRPAALPQGDFRAAVAFYPAYCSDAREPAGWINDIPLLVLNGAEDVWTPLAACQSFVAGAQARGARIELQVYPGAYHDFDAPNLSRRELPEYRTASGVVPILGTDPAARQDAFARVPAFFARYMGN